MDDMSKIDWPIENVRRFKFDLIRPDYSVVYFSSLFCQSILRQEETNETLTLTSNWYLKSNEITWNYNDIIAFNAQNENIPLSDDLRFTRIFSRSESQIDTIEVAPIHDEQYISIKIEQRFYILIEKYTVIEVTTDIRCAHRLIDAYQFSPVN